MADNTRIYDKFEYHLEDTNCVDCLYYIGKKRGCELKSCCCEDIRADAVATGRLKRDRGWSKWHM